MDSLPVHPHIAWIAVVAVTILASATALRLYWLRGVENQQADARRGSLKTWWCFTGVVLCAALAGRIVTLLIVTAISVWALIEFLRLSKQKPIGRAVETAAVALILLNSILLARGDLYPNIVFLPLAGILLTSIISAASEPTEQVPWFTAYTYYGTMLTGYGLSFMALLFWLPVETNPGAGSAGWFLFLIAVTEINDIAQALVGRRLGAHRVAPVLSPHKSWEGLAGGIGVAAGCGAVLGPFLTPLSLAASTAAGVLIALAGFAGDLNISACKRAAHVKDSGDWLPGQGGILDRVDSLTFTAPAFYLFLSYFLQP